MEPLFPSWLHGIARVYAVSTSWFVGSFTCGFSVHFWFSRTVLPSESPACMSCLDHYLLLSWNALQTLCPGAVWLPLNTLSWKGGMSAFFFPLPISRVMNWYLLGYLQLNYKLSQDTGAWSSSCFINCHDLIGQEFWRAWLGSLLM